MTYFYNTICPKRAIKKITTTSPTYIYDKKYLILSNISHLFIFFTLLTSKDIFLNIIVILYVVLDLLTHNVEQFSKNKILYKTHLYVIYLLIFYVFSKLICSYHKNRNIEIFLPLIIYCLMEYYKGYSIELKENVCDQDIYNEHMKSEFIIHSIIWFGITMLNINYPDFNKNIILSGITMLNIDYPSDFNKTLL